ncbi:zinc metalloprotease HtpX [Halomonas beimenensis]|uniref:Peptidase M48 domain-containing protein n=1 Tax=Halomonas beimenensis TaxID=475662 RepID=A0A291P500_9GAMM|nr:zinc metalloprotease HtpX [Halomonas beimenensis]ATJ81932.1 hypothetical protein BEI_0945 [Halomonas beimenensis]
MALRQDRLTRNRLTNGLQTLLIMIGLALSLSVPGYLLAGIAGVLVCLSAVLFATLMTSWMPARLILAQAGAGRLAPQHAPELYRVLAHLYERAGLQLTPQLYYAPSPDLNAFAVGTRHDGGIAVTEGLLRSLSLRELAGVLAHEVSHLRHGDTRVMSIAAAMTRLTLWLTTAIQLAILISLPLVLAGQVTMPWLTLLVVAFTPTVSTLLSLALSRNREYTADMEAAALTGDPEGLASALAVLERHHGLWLSSLFGRHRPVEIEWLRTHPSTRERIRRLAEIDDDRRRRHHPSLRPPHSPHPVVRQRPAALRHRDWLRRR